MSRIGKIPVNVPEKVEVKINGHHVVIKGPKGQLENTFTDVVGIELKEKQIITTPKNDSKECMALWGTTRALLSNMVVGVTDGFKRPLEINGVGYKAQAKGSKLTLNLGYSNPIEYELPKGIEASVDRNILSISGIDKELVGFVAAKVRSFRPPEPYKGKGIRYVGEMVKRKAGKTGVKQA